MTPGFDVFYISFASRRLYTILNPDATPGVMGNSMQMTFFAEMWLLMGWWSLLALFFAPLFFCCLVYVGKRTFQNSTIIQILIYSYILSLFYYWIEGMGTDMLLVLHGVYSLIFLTVLLSVAFLSSKLSARWKN